MYDLTALLTQVSNVINAALAIIDPTTPIGALFLVSVGVIVIGTVLKMLRSVLPRG